MRTFCIVEAQPHPDSDVAFHYLEPPQLRLDVEEAGPQERAHAIHEVIRVLGEEALTTEVQLILQITEDNVVRKDTRCALGTFVNNMAPPDGGFWAAINQARVARSLTDEQALAAYGAFHYLDWTQGGVYDRRGLAVKLEGSGTLIPDLVVDIIDAAGTAAAQEASHIGATHGCWQVPLQWIELPDGSKQPLLLSDVQSLALGRMDDSGTFHHLGSFIGHPE